MIPVPHMKTMSTSSEISTTSMISDHQLRPRYPINYNEKVLTKLHRLLQIRTFNNLSIPLPVTETESEEDENYEHYTNPDLPRPLCIYCIFYTFQDHCYKSNIVNIVQWLQTCK